MSCIMYKGSLIVLCLILLCTCRANKLYKYGESRGDNKLPSFDETSSEEIQLRTPFVYYSSEYTSLFVSIC